MRGRVSEKVEQAHGVTLLRMIGAAVYVLGHPSPKDGRKFRGTGQTAGLPDVYAFLPQRIAPTCRLLPVALWWECKAVGGRVRPEQAAFRDSCARAGVAHVVGPYDALVLWLTDAGYVDREYGDYRVREAKRHAEGGTNGSV